MDERTHNNNNNIYRNASPMTPNTPSNAFQTNVNRSKTRKWVEAKKQTYDGDDWGNDFEDDENEPDEEAPPPPRTAGMRQVGQDVQQPSQQPSGSRSVSQPTSAFGHIRGQSFGRNPSGPPALQLQTQQPTPSQHFDPVETFSTYEAPSAGGGPDYRYAAPVTSPQSGGTRPFPQEPGYAGRKDYSQVPQDRGSPALTSAGPAQRFPPRKSSMGQQDAPTHGDTASSRSGSRPGSSGRPWVDQRSNSPGRQASPPVGLPSKPLPFIRPADIYRRMEEEKEKERKSMDSAGRPSIDSIPGVGSDRSSSPANVVRPLADQRRRTSFDRDESVDSSRGLKPTLTPVAEGRSESGLDRLPTGVNPEASDITGREATHRPQEATTSTHVVEPVSQPSFQRPSNNPEDRRKSISPRLPDLTRLSGFGADFFSGPSEFPGAGHLSNPATPESEPRASYSEPDQQLNEQSQATPVQFDTARQLSPTSSHSTEPTLTKHVPSDDGSVALLPSSLTAGPALVNRMDTPLHVPQQEQPSPNTASSDTRDSSPSGNNTITERLKPSRPSIPGGWVTETTVLGSETPTPMERPDPSVSQLSPVQDISEASPVTGLEVDDLVPTTVVNQTPSLADGSVAVARKQIKQTEAGDDFGQTTGHHDQEIASEAVAAGPGFNSTVRTLPPLETPNPLFVSNTSPVVGAAAHTSEAKSSPPYEDSPSKHSASTHPSAVNASSAFSPIAPLNTKGSNVSVSDFTPPQFLSRNVTMSSMDTGSPNESDRLRDDIINSLSPINPATVFSAPSAAPYSAGGSSPEMARESRYLSGVYDDYMGFVEDKTLPETAQEFKDKRANAADSPEQSYPLQTVVADSRLVSSTDSSGAGKAPKTVPSLQSRFSWEGGSEQALAPNEGNRPHISEAEEVHDSAATTRQSASPEPQESMPAPALQVEREHDGTISHQVSLLSSHAPAGLGVSGMELPSPISVLSSDRSFGVAENQGRRLSLAEEKVLIRVSSNPVSPSPPQGEHPALARTPPAEPLPVPDVTNPLPPPPKSTNLTGWRDILSLPSPALRIQKFDETRSQYLSMDSGLSNWLEHMDTLSEHGARQSPRGPPPDLHTSGGPAPGPLTASPTGVPAPTQQPYYQQYLNASNPNLMVGPLPSGPVRPPTGNLASSGQPAVSGFGNPPKTQVGAKSKELLQAASVFGNKATKAGMKSGLKLFNKGKDRLRGNGDKDLEEPQLHAQLSSPLSTSTSQTATSRNERRSSWGFSWIGSRSQGRQGTALHPSSKHGSHSPSFSPVQHLVQRDPKPAPPPTARAATVLAAGLSQQPSGTAAAPAAPSSAHLQARGRPTASASSAFGPASAPAPAPAPAAATASNSSHLRLPQLSLPRNFSPFRRSSPSRRSRPSSWLLPTRERVLIPQFRRNSSSFEVPLPSAPRSPPRPVLVSSTSAASPSPACQKVNISPGGELQLKKPAPISKNQPTWDPYTATPLAEEDEHSDSDFGFEVAALGHHSAPRRSSITSPDDRDAVHLTTDDRSDDWIEVGHRESATLRLSNPPSDSPRKMTAPLIDARPVPSPMRYSQQGSSSAEAPRVDSFIGLPPIRRTSTFGLLGDKKGHSDELAFSESPFASPEEDPTLPAPAGPISMVSRPSNGPQMSSQPVYDQRQPQQFESRSQQVTQANQQGSLVNGQNGYNVYTEPSTNYFPPGHISGQNGFVQAQEPDHGQRSQQPQRPVLDPTGPVPRGPLSQFTVQGQPGSPPLTEQPLGQSSLRSGMPSPPTSTNGGNPIHRFPLQGQWKLEESHLSEPLHTSRKTQGSPPAQQPGYYAEDKELGSLNPGGSSQAPQRTTRNNGLPPVSAQRFPGLFPAGSSNQSPVQQDQIQIGPAAQQAQQQRRDSMGVSRASTQEFDDNRRQSSGLLNQIGEKFLPSRGRSDSISKDEPTVQTDEASVSETSVLTDEPPEKKHKRASFFGIGSVSNNGPQPQSGDPEQSGQQPQHFGPPEKKKTFFGPGGLAKQIKGKTDHTNVNTDVGSSQGAGAKKRLSELKGMFKVASKDDTQSGKPEPAQAVKQYTQGPPRAFTGGNVRPQGPQPGQPQQFGQPGLMAPPAPVNRGRSSTQSSVQGSPMGMPPSLEPLRPQHTGDGKERKPSAGGFLGSIFSNRPGSSAKDSKLAPGSVPPHGQFGAQPGNHVAQQFGPGQSRPFGPHHPQRVAYPGLPGYAPGHSGPNGSIQGQPGMRDQYPLPTQQSQRPGVYGPPESYQSPPQDEQASSAHPTSVFGPAGALMGTRPASQTALPSQLQQQTSLQHFNNGQRPGMPPPQGSRGTLKPEEHEFSLALGSNPITTAGETPQTLTAPLDDFSRRSSQDRLSIGGSSLLPRVSPNRKPVGSGPFRSTSGNVPTVQAESSEDNNVTSQPGVQPSKTLEPSSEFGGDGRQKQGEIHLPDQALRFNAPSHNEHVRRPSFPTSSQSSVPIQGSPVAQQRLSLQSGQPHDTIPAYQQGVTGSLLPMQPPTGPNRDGAPSTMRILSGQISGNGHGQLDQHVLQHPQQPALAGPENPAFGQQPRAQQMQPSQAWGFSRTGTHAALAAGPQGQPQQAPQQGRGIPGPGAVPEHKGTIPKFLAGPGNRRETTSPQPSAGGPSAVPKENQSTSSKLLSVFKRTKQQNPNQAPQQRPPLGQQVAPPMMQGGRGQASYQPHQPSLPVPPQIVQAGRGQPVSGPSPSQGFFGPMPGQQQSPAQGAVQSAQFGRGQVPPPQMPGGRGQPPPQTRVGHGQISPAVIPMMQSNRSQTTAQRQQQPQYAAVPIPRGYEAVHGYGVPNMVAHSPYNISRGSPSQQFGPQFQPMVPQHTGTSQQLQPMNPQYTGASQYIQQMQPHHTGTSQQSQATAALHTINSQADVRLPSPAPSQQTSSPYGQPQGHGQILANHLTNIPQNPQSRQPQNQTQYQQLAPQHTGSPAPQQQRSFTPPHASHSPDPHNTSHDRADANASPDAHFSQRREESPAGARNLEPGLSMQHHDESSSTSTSSGYAGQPQLQNLVIAVDDLSSQPRVLHESSPQNQPLPDSAATFSPINSGTGRLPDPPLPPTSSVQDAHGQQPLNRITHNISPPNDATGSTHPGIRHVTTSFPNNDGSRHQPLSLDVTAHRTFSVSPEPPRLRPAPSQSAPASNLSVNVNKANDHTPDHDDMYDATPRSEQAPIQTQPVSYRAETARNEVNGVAIAGGAAAGVAAGALAHGQSSRRNSYQHEQPQAKAPVQAAPVEPEEKILVDEPVELAAFHDDGDDLPTMSATSYPGQEWNPYGAGEFGDWEQ